MAINNSTTVVTSVESGTGWSLDVTDANLSSDLSTKDFFVQFNGVLQDNADFSKDSRTQVTYNGVSIASSTVTFFRFTTIDRVQEMFYGDRIQSALWEEELNTIHRILNEIELAEAVGLTTVEVSSDDAAAGFLENKIVAGANVSINVLSPGGIEQLEISATDNDEFSKVSANDITAGYLNGKLVEGTAIDFTENTDGGNETLTIAVDESEITPDVVEPLYSGLITDGITVSGWDDIIADLVIRGAGAADPAISTFRGFFRAYEFNNTQEKELFADLHITHGFKPGTGVYLHVHYSPETVAVAGVVRWGFEYSYAAGHQTDEFPASTTIYVNQTVDTSYRHYVAEIAAPVEAGNAEPDGLFLVRVFRDATDAADTYGASVWIHTVDAHYQVDRVGTKNRSPNFYDV